MDGQVAVLSGLDGHHRQALAIGFAESLGTDIMPLSVVEPSRVISGEVERCPFGHLSGRQTRETESSPIIVNPCLKGDFTEVGEGYGDVPAVITVGDYGTLAPEGFPFLPDAHLPAGIEPCGIRDTPGT